METILIFAFYKSVYEPCWDIVRKDSETENEAFTRSPWPGASMCAVLVSQPFHV